jgi:hypothetical protein
MQRPKAACGFFPKPDALCDFHEDQVSQCGSCGPQSDDEQRSAEATAPLNEETMKQAWQGACDILRAQGVDPEDVLRDAAANVDAWRWFANIDRGRGMTLIGCEKGMCLRKATRTATYAVRVPPLTVTMQSCDLHGMDPATDLSQAAEARAWNADPKNAWIEDPK